MNSQAPHPPSPPPPSSASGFFASVRRLAIWRSNDRWAGGVAAGLAHRFGLDPLLVRGLFVVATLFGGLGLVLYGLAWMFLPEASDGRIHLEEAVGGRFDIALAGAIAVTVAGLSRPVFWWHGSWWALPWTVALVAVIAVVLLSTTRTTSPPPHPGGGPTPPQPPYPGGPTPPPPYPGGPTPPPPTDPADPGWGGDPDGEGSGQGDATGWDDATGQGAGSGWGTGSGWGDSTGSGGGTGWGGRAGWGAGPAGPGDPGHTPPPPPPVPGPGSRTTSLVLAVCLLGAAGVALAHQQGALDGSAWLIAGGGVLTVLGAGVLVSGIRGRTQGGLGVLALFLALVMVPAAAATTAVPGFTRIGTSPTTFAGDPTFAPRTAEEAAPGYSLVAGDLTVDLTRLDGRGDITVPVAVTFGSLHLVVPEEADVTIDAGVGAGEIVGRLSEDWTGPNLPAWGSTRTEDSLTNGVGISTTLSRDGDGTGPQIVVDAEVSFGQLRIEEAS